jgi:UDP-2-acetamido-3-amino-2,3-dideoxy-glucuronate N-acetyltransferase
VARAAVTQPARIHPTAEVEAGAEVGAGTSVWQLAHVRAGARVGAECVIGRGAYVGPGVRIGDRVKIQNHALVYEPARVGDGVFIGPAVVLTNDLHPRAVTADGALKTAADWDSVGVVLADGCSLGARSVLLPGVTVGRWAMVAAGAVVTRDVRPYELVGGVPARHLGWVGRAGRRLAAAGPDRWRCPVTGEVYTRAGDGIAGPGQSL